MVGNPEDRFCSDVARIDTLSSVAVQPNLCLTVGNPEDRFCSDVARIDTLSSVAVQPNLCRTWSETLKTGFVVMWLG